jgi:hypothetical protein
MNRTFRNNNLRKQIGQPVPINLVDLQAAQIHPDLGTLIRGSLRDPRFRFCPRQILFRSGFRD